MGQTKINSLAELAFLRVILTSGRQDESSPTTQFAAATKYGTFSDIVYTGRTRVRRRVAVYPGCLSLKNCICSMKTHRFQFKLIEDVNLHHTTVCSLHLPVHHKLSTPQSNCNTLNKGEHLGFQRLYIHI